MKYLPKKLRWLIELTAYFINNHKKIKGNKELCSKLLFYGIPLTEVFTFSGFCYLCIDLFKSHFDEIAVNHQINRLLPKTLIDHKSLYIGKELDVIWSHVDQSFDVRSNEKLNKNERNQCYMKSLESIYPDLRNLLESLEEFKVFPDSRSLTAGDDWKWFSLEEKHKDKGRIRKIIDSLDINTHFGFYPFISKLEPSSYIAPHCGSTTFRHRIHLGISIPEPKEGFIVVNNVKYYWQEGKAFIFDDSLTHEVTHSGKKTRVILIIDVWPDSMDMKTKEYLKHNSYWLKDLAVLSN